MFLVEEETWEQGVYQYELTDPVQGGPNGMDNVQGKQLANRTNWLKANKQDKDATLIAIAALVTAADKMIYATGSDTFAMTTLTAFARTLLDDVDAAAMRATIGAQPAGSYQASNATLTAIAALVTAADKMIYATGSDTFATTTLTAFARTLLDDADLETMRNTLGIVDGIGVGQTWQNMTGSRAAGTTYTNTTGKTIMVSVRSAQTTSMFCTITVNGFSFSNTFGGITSYQNNTVLVPNGGTYMVGFSPGAVGQWLELR